mgnify:FL=1
MSEENENRKSSEKEDGLYFGDIVKLDVLAVDFWKGFKKLWWLSVIIITALSLFAYYNCKKSYVPKYTAQASFSISTMGTSGATGASTIQSYYNSALAEQLSKTFGFIINSSTMRQILMDRLGVNGLNGTITASNDVQNAPLFTITVTSTSAQDAYDILCAVIENYPRLAQYVLGETSMSIYSPAQLPEKPSNKFSYKRDVFIAAVAGVFLSCVIFALYAISKNTVKKRDDIKEKLNLKCVGEVPWVEVKKRKRYSSSLVTISQRNADFSESFRYLKRRVLKQLEKDSGKVISVTSAMPGEGKTTVSYNLALAISRSGKKVALLDADFARMSVQKYLGVTLLSRGVMDYIDGDCGLENLATRGENENFHIFYAGSKKLKTIPKEPLLRLFDYLRENYDYVVADAPPCGMVSDAAQIINLTDETLFVIRQDYTPVSKIKRALQYIYDINKVVSGAVFNAVQSGFSGYKSDYYGYSGKYGYYGKRYGYYGKRYGYYGNKKYGYSGNGYGYGGRKHGYGGYDSYGGYGYGYFAGGKRITENPNDKKE